MYIELLQKRKEGVAMKKIKDIVCSLGKHTAYNSVGKSFPIALYEPKLPNALKEKAAEKK